MHFVCLTKVPSGFTQDIRTECQGPLQVGQAAACEGPENSVSKAKDASHVHDWCR